MVHPDWTGEIQVTDAAVIIRSPSQKLNHSPGGYEKQLRHAPEK